MNLEKFLFIICCIIGGFYFIKNSYTIYKNISLGIPINRFNNKTKRWKNVISIAFGQSKMFKNPIIGLLHFFIYIGFFILNLELLEFFLDKFLNSHRFFLPILGKKNYQIFILILESFSLLIILSIIVFLIRRNILFIKRFSFDLQNHEKKDANIILIIELFLILTFLLFNTTDPIIIKYNFFLFTNNIFPLIKKIPINKFYYIYKISWWLHFLGILYFLNYLFYSKHLHIFLAFPSIFFANINSIGKINDIKEITKEIKNILNIDIKIPTNNNEKNIVQKKFGASDIFDLNQVQLLNSYTCTECGRCTEVCPANITGKKLSPRKILMSTRDRLEEVSKNIKNNQGKFIPDGKQLLKNYITEEEIWACTTCNACTEICPILLDPLSIIIDIRRYLIMEQSKGPKEINLMFNNIENNGVPWKFNQLERKNWIKK